MLFERESSPDYRSGIRELQKHERTHHVTPYQSCHCAESGQPIYYVGGHTGHVLTHEQGQQDAHTWADYINVGMEHGAFDMAGLDAYMHGLVDSGGPAAAATARRR